MSLTFTVLHKLEEQNNEDVHEANSLEQVEENHVDKLECNWN